jgi:ABC-2 type transport system permease protein
MNTTVAQLTWSSLLGRRRALVLVLLPAVLLLLAVVIRATAGQDLAIATFLLGSFALGTLMPLLGLLAGTGSIGPEIDDGSVVYLLAKPLSRASIAVTKYAVAAVTVVAFGVLPTLVAGLLVAGGRSGVALGYTVATLAAGLAYAAVFLLLAVITRNAVVVGLLYALVWESVVGGFVPGAQTLSIQQWGLALAEGIVGTDAKRLGVTSPVPLPLAVVLLVVVTAGAVWLAGRRLASLRLSSDE